mmetsp:Transcript_4883/g.5669  ORF Transcript_4883/g.5669 Transcript_4883/m.5669 type:complete len:99 (-) Transcript_4883:1927-2223(-)
MIQPQETSVYSQTELRSLSHLLVELKFGIGLARNRLFPDKLLRALGWISFSIFLLGVLALPFLDKLKGFGIVSFFFGILGTTGRFESCSVRIGAALNL